MYDTDTSLRAILGAIAAGAALDETLLEIAGVVVDRLGVGSCKIWLVKQGDLCATCALAESCPDRTNCLHLKASSPGIGVEMPRVPLVVFRDRTAARGGSGRVGDGGAAGRLLFGADEVALAGGDAYTLVPLKGPAGVVGLLGVLRDTPLLGGEADALRGLADAAVVAIRIADLTSRHQRATNQLGDADRAHAALRELLSTLLDHARDVAVVAEDLEGRITAYSEGAKAIYGYEREEMVGRDMADALYAPEEVLSGRIVKILDETMKTGRYETVVMRRRKDGERFPSRASFFVRRDPDGDPSGVVVVERDVSEEKELVRLREENAELRERIEHAREIEDLMAIRVETIRELRERIDALTAGREAGEQVVVPEPADAEEPLSFVIDASEGLVFAAGDALVDLVEERLVTAGRNVSVADVPASAVALARELRPGIVVADIAGAGGWDVVNALLRQAIATRIVAIGAEEERGLALARGVYCFVEHPVEAEALDAAIARASSRPVRLLGVVDDADARREVASLLDHPGLAPAFEPSWAAARERLASESVDAILLDLYMPGALGFALLDVDSGKHPPVLLVADDLGPAESRARDLCAAILPRTGLDRERLLAAIDRLF